MATESKTSLANKHLGNDDYFVIIASCSHSIMLAKYTKKWSMVNRSAVEANLEDEGITDVCIRCFWNLKLKKFHVVALQTASKQLVKLRASLAIRLLVVLRCRCRCRCRRRWLNSLMLHKPERDSSKPGTLTTRLSCQHDASETWRNYLHFAGAIPHSHWDYLPSDTVSLWLITV